MASDNAPRGKKRSKSFYKKSSYGGKRQCTGRNVLEAGISGFLVMCHGNESGAVKESYNILNEYGDVLYGPDNTRQSSKLNSTNPDMESDDGEDDCDDIEKAMQKEVNDMKNVSSAEKRFQNVATKVKNCVFIRTTVTDPVELVIAIMEDIAQKNLKKARFAARMLPIVGTCKAQTAAILELAKTSLGPYFSKEKADVPSSFTIVFKARNNNGTTCGKDSVISALRKEILAINPALTFSWNDFEVAILVEVVCTVCCLGVAPRYDKLRKYNFQELSQGPKEKKEKESVTVSFITTSEQHKESITSESQLEKELPVDDGSVVNTGAEKISVEAVDRSKISEIENEEVSKAAVTPEEAEPFSNVEQSVVSETSETEVCEVETVGNKSDEQTISDERPTSEVNCVVQDIPRQAEDEDKDHSESRKVAHTENSGTITPEKE